MEFSPENHRRLKCAKCKQEKAIIYFFDIPSLYRGNRTCLACNPKTYNFPDPVLALEDTELELDLQKKSLRSIMDE